MEGILLAALEELCIGIVLPVLLIILLRFISWCINPKEPNKLWQKLITELVN